MKKIQESFIAWLNDNMRQGQRDVPARLVTLLGLLERLRQVPVLQLEKHKAASGQQLAEHNHFVDQALDRFALQSPVQERGRRSNNLSAWANPLFKWLKDHGFLSGATSKNADLITSIQSLAACRLSAINDDKPLVVRYNLGSAVAVISDILDQAQDKKRSKDVAEYLVGAKLELRFGEGVVKPKNVNTPSLGSLADFRIGNSAIEVTTLEKADESHLNQIKTILNDTGLEVWLLTRKRSRENWQIAIEAILGIQSSRVVIADIETFVGQNISEIAVFSGEAVKKNLAKLFERYENHWLPTAGTSGLRISDLENCSR